jgi:YidC/Oxa1 family membrane protein insertase
MDKNTVIAIFIILGIVLAFQFLFIRPQLQKKAAENVQELAESPKVEEGTIPPETAPGKEQLQKITPQEGQPVEKQVSIETDKYSVTLDSAGANITSLKLKKYLDKEEQPVDLVVDNDGDILPFEVHFERLKDIPFGDRTPYYVDKVSDTSYLFYRDFLDDNGKPFRFSKLYTFEKDEYMFDILIKASSLDGSEIFINKDNVSYTLAWGPDLGPISVVKNRYNITTEGYYENGKYHKVLRGAGGCSLRRAEARYVELSRILNWAGVTNRYFFIGIVPEKRSFIYSFDQRTQGKYFLGVSRPFFKGQDFEDTYKIYAGPKERTLLKGYGENFDAVLSGRILRPIVIFLEVVIKFFYSFTHNYGIAIILMTIMIKIILHPLTFKSFESMRRMSTLQPKVNEIREKYKSSPQQMNKEIQAMYRREKINPMGGCLPLLLQLPIFYSLYTLLSGMVQLRNESFLWIKDLSLPDTVATLKTAIPLLGYRVDGQGFTDINILPFIMTATTLLQSKLTSGDQTAQQGKMMTYLFPIMFFFIFWNMPSGLVLYWTIQNILTIGQQFYIDYRLKKRKAEAAKVEARKPVRVKKKKKPRR